MHVPVQQSAEREHVSAPARQPGWHERPLPDSTQTPEQQSSGTEQGCATARQAGMPGGRQRSIPMAVGWHCVGGVVAQHARVALGSPATRQTSPATAQPSAVAQCDSCVIGSGIAHVALQQSASTRQTSPPSRQPPIAWQASAPVPSSAHTCEQQSDARAQAAPIGVHVASAARGSSSIASVQPGAPVASPTVRASARHLEDIYGRYSKTPRRSSVALMYVRGAPPWPVRQLVARNW